MIVSQHLDWLEIFLHVKVTYYLDDESLSLFTYFNAIFLHINDLSRNLQGCNKNIILMTGQIIAFTKKLVGLNLAKHNFDTFTFLNMLTKIWPSEILLIESTKIHLQWYRWFLLKIWVFKPFKENVGT